MPLPSALPGTNQGNRLPDLVLSVSTDCRW